MKKVLLLALAIVFNCNPMGPPGGPAVVASPAVLLSWTEKFFIGGLGVIGASFVALAWHGPYKSAYPLPFNVNRTSASCYFPAEWPILQSELDIIGEYTDKTCIPVCTDSGGNGQRSKALLLFTGSYYTEEINVQENDQQHSYILCKNGSWLGAVKSVFKQLGGGFKAFDTINEQGLVIPTEYADSVIDFEAYNEMLLHEEDILRGAAKKARHNPQQVKARLEDYYKNEYSDQCDQEE